MHAAADADFVRGYLVPALNLPPERVLLAGALPLGGSVAAEIDRGVADSRVTVIVLSPAYLADHWAVFGEQLASHAGAQAGAQGGRMVPLRLTECELPLRLDFRVSLDFTDPVRWDAETTRLRRLLSSAPPSEDKIPCPYPGMRPFVEADASRFFGRDPEIADLVGRLDRGERAIYVIGPSGSGKSSLVQAGLRHVLDTGSSRLGRSFVVRDIRPGERPAARLASVLEGDLATPAATVAAFVARHPPAAHVLVVADQLEELFTVTGPDERHRFIAALRRLRSVPQCHVLLVVRADFYGALLDSELGPDLAGPDLTSRISPLTVASLRGAALAQAIRAPALRAGVHVEARLCDRLVADAAGEPGALPLVQETLRLLWDQRRHRLLGLDQYEALAAGGRGLDAAIAKRAGTMMSTLTGAQQLIARRVLVRLVSFGEGRVDTRRQQPVRALRSAADREAELSRVVRHLVEHRMVTLDGSETSDGALADLAHEALITGWPALRAWIDHRRADEQRRRSLEAKVADWIGRGRGTVSLLDPVELSEAEQWMQGDAARELGYAADLRALAAASRGEIEKAQQQRRLRTLRALAVLIVFSVVVSVLGLVAWRQQMVARRQQHEAQDQARQALATSYLEQGRLLLLDGHPMQALPLLVAARTENLDGPVLQMLFAQAASNVPLVTLIGHGARVTAVAFSGNGRQVLTASDDNTAQAWDASTGRRWLSPLYYAGARVTVTGFSAGGARVVTVSDDNRVRTLDVATGELHTALLAPRGKITSAAFSADGTRVITASDDHAAQVWDGRLGELLIGPLEHHGKITAMAFSADGARVVTGSDDRTARVWDVTTGKPVTPSLEHHGAVTITAFSADGTRVVTASENQAQVWDATTGRPVTSPVEHLGAITTAALSADGARLVTASGDATARIWDAATGRPVATALEHRDRVTAAAFSADGTRVVTASWDATARVWDAATGRPVTAPLEHPGRVTAAAFSADGTRVVTACDDRMARVWDARAAEVSGVWLEHRDIVTAAAFSADGTRVVTASNDGTAQVWDAATGKPVGAALQHQGRVTAAAFSVDGTRVVTASDDRTARIWDAATARPLTPPIEHRYGVDTAVFSAEGKYVFTVSHDDRAQLWEAATGKPVFRSYEHGRSDSDGHVVRNAATPAPGASSPDDRGWVTIAALGGKYQDLVATAGRDNAVWLWTLGGQQTRPLEHQDRITAITYAPDRARVVIASRDSAARGADAPSGTHGEPPDLARPRVLTASRDNTARVWDAWSGEPVTPPLRHQGAVTAAVFSADATRVVTASEDHTARIWDAATGRPLTAPLGHQHIVTAAAFSADGTFVVTASRDTTARVWDATTGKPLTGPLRHGGVVTAAAFSPDGTRLVTASEDRTARVWTLPMHTGSLDDWRRVAQCSPFVLSNRVVIANSDPPAVCSATASTSAPR